MCEVGVYQALQTVVGSPFVVGCLLEECGEIRSKGVRTLAVGRHQRQKAPAHLTTVTAAAHKHTAASPTLTNADGPARRSPSRPIDHRTQS